MPRILIPLPSYGFDPSEAAIPWKVLANRGHQVVFATPDGKAGTADEIMLTGRGLGIWKWLLGARGDAVAAYRQMEATEAFQNPIPYTDLQREDFDGLLLPGGHEKSVRPYLESPILQDIVVSFVKSGKPLGAVCHGVLLAARSIDPETNMSVIAGTRVTSLLRSQELLAWRLTRLWLGDYYLTYPGHTVEEEVRSLLSPEGQFIPGPMPWRRDKPGHLERGFALQHGALVTARWPGDAYNLAEKFSNLLEGRSLDEAPSETSPKERTTE